MYFEKAHPPGAIKIPHERVEFTRLLREHVAADPADVVWHCVTLGRRAGRRLLEVVVRRSAGAAQNRVELQHSSSVVSRRS